MNDDETIVSSRRAVWTRITEDPQEPLSDVRAEWLKMEWYEERTFQGRKIAIEHKLMRAGWECDRPVGRRSDRIFPSESKIAVATEKTKEISLNLPVDTDDADETASTEDQFIVDESETDKAEDFPVDTTDVSVSVSTSQAAPRPVKNEADIKCSAKTGETFLRHRYGNGDICKRCDMAKPVPVVKPKTNKDAAETATPEDPSLFVCRPASGPAFKRHRYGGNDNCKRCGVKRKVGDIDPDVSVVDQNTDVKPVTDESTSTTDTEGLF